MAGARPGFVWRHGEGGLCGMDGGDGDGGDGGGVVVVAAVVVGI